MKGERVGREIEGKENEVEGEWETQKNGTEDEGSESRERRREISDRDRKLLGRWRMTEKKGYTGGTGGRREGRQKAETGHVRGGLLEHSIWRKVTENGYKGDR